MVTGEVLVNDEPARNKLSRFIEKKIHQWIEHHQELSPDQLNYRVTFSDDDDVNQVSCETEITVGGHLWRGCELANDTQIAFIHSLKRLQQH
jgi:hypothetical protein